MYDGTLYTSLKFNINENDQKIVSLIDTALKKNKSRSMFCSDIMKKYKNLEASYCWPSLRLIGCWLGGSVGYHANKLEEYYGNTPMRDIGYSASEGCFSLPYADNTPSGILVLQNNFYEFIKEDDINKTVPNIFLSHELEKGKKYRILITNESGLYRYDINDTIKVEDFYNNVPIISFIRKTGDFLNITGEKIHINQILLSLETISKEININITQFRVVPNLNKLRYEIFIQFENRISKGIIKNKIIPAIDAHLSSINIEYAQKRKSKRLHCPCLHIMDQRWEEDVKKAFIASGKRDIQFKWQNISSDFLEVDWAYVTDTVQNE